MCCSVLCVSHVLVLRVMQVVLQEQQSSGDGEGAALALLPGQRGDPPRQVPHQL